jgi:hypothetical protein
LARLPVPLGELKRFPAKAGLKRLRAGAFFLQNQALPDIRCTRFQADSERAVWSAAIAQLVEHVIRNDGVTGSSPVCGTSPFFNPKSGRSEPRMGFVVFVTYFDDEPARDDIAKRESPAPHNRHLPVAGTAPQGFAIEALSGYLLSR